MGRRRAVVVAVVLLGGAAALVAASGTLPALLYETDGYTPPGTTSPTATGTGASGTPTPSAYDHATLTVLANGTNETLGTVRVAVADTPEKRYTGLSKTESLPENRGMLFVYDAPANHTYVMRGMSFGIDIVYVGADGRITRIHHAPEPPAGADGEDYRYPGYGQYVLEVTYEWTVRHNVSVGDRVRISGL